MNNKKTVKNIKTPNKFGGGGTAFGQNFKQGWNSAMGLPEGSTFRDMFSAENLGKSLGSAAPGMAGLAGGIAGGLISDGFSTVGGQVLSGIGDAAMMFNPLIGGAIKLASGLVNRSFGTKWDNKALANAEANIGGLNSFISGASNYDALSSDFSNVARMNKLYKASDFGEDGWLVDRTQNKANEINADMNNAYKTALSGLGNTADNIAGSTLANLERNYAAFGGPLFAYGGQTHGSDFTNGLMFINNGGTHESNPYEGVPISMDQEGNPNLVEEGEVIWNDYVFSNRLKVPKSIKKKYKLGKKEMTFANAIDKLSKESEERPNDPISTRGLEDILMHMAIEQETIKSKKQNKKVENNKFVEGGPTSGMSWFQNSNGNYYQEYLDAVNALTKQQYIDYIKRSTGRDVAYTDQEFNKIKAGMTDGNYGQGHIDMYNIMQSQPLKVSNANLESLTSPVKPLNVEELKLVNTGKKPATLNIPELNKYKTWMRYAPAIGHGALAITDAFGLTNKPDYSNAEAIIEASKKASVYNPVKFKPIGDYLTYNPFDTEYHANQLRSVSGATRRNIMNTSGGNRAAAMAGILASDNNTMNQLGDLYRKAAEYNLEQKQKVADFNRATNITNSEGFLKADMANQSAAAQARALGLEGLMTGYKMKEQANLMSDQAKAANISGLLTSLGNIGYENVNRNMMNWGMASGTWAPSQWKYDPLTGKPVNQNE